MYEKQIAVFDEIAKTWDSREKADPTNSINKLVSYSKISEGYKILDVGCGTGILSDALIEAAGKSGSVKGIDISSGMINVAREKFDFKNLTFEHTSVEALKDESNSYDIIVCNNVFPHFEDVDGVMLNSIRLLKDGGLFVVTHLAGRDAVNKIHSNTNTFNEDKVPVPEEWIKIFKKYGLKEVKAVDEADFYYISMQK